MEKNNKGIVTLLVVFIFTTLVLGGYLVYDKVLSKGNVNDNTNAENNSTTNEENNENNEILNNEVGQVLNSMYGIFVIDTDGSVYFKPNEKVENLGTFKKDTSLGTINTYQTKVYETSPSVYTFEGYKLDLTNIVSGYQITIGNGTLKTIFFIDKLGNVFKVNFTYEKDIIDYSNIEKLTSYSNIVSIVETSTGGYSGGYNAVFIDKNNKQYKY